MSTPAPLAADPTKTYEKRYKAVVPIPLPDDTVRPDTLDEATHPDFAIARWLGRESFENTAAGDRLAIVEYSERLIPLDELDPRLVERLGPLDRFVWFEFAGVGRLDVDAFNWFAAEFEHNCEAWLAAEREHQDAGDVEDQADS